jgi:hypothetical protein
MLKFRLALGLDLKKEIEKKCEKSLVLRDDTWFLMKK